MEKKKKGVIYVYVCILKYNKMKYHKKLVFSQYNVIIL